MKSTIHHCFPNGSNIRYCVSHIKLLDSQNATEELISLPESKKEIFFFQEPYIYRSRVRELRTDYHLVIGTEGDDRPRTSLMMSSDFRMVRLSHLETRDVTAVILEKENRKT